MGIIKDNLYRFSSKRFLPVFRKGSIFPYYHIVRDESVKHIENLYEFKNVAQFKSDLDFLLRHYQPIDPKDLLMGERPENGFLLTFDDGLEEVYSVIFPILKEKNLKAVFFINPDFVDNGQSLYKHDISLIIQHLKELDFPSGKMEIVAGNLSFDYSSEIDFAAKFKNAKFTDRHKIRAIANALGVDIDNYLMTQKPYVSKAQIQEMINGGFYFGGHTMSHPPLDQLAFEAQKAEIIDSVNWLKTNFGISYSMFAFPFSDKSASKTLIRELFEYDKDLLLFGNSGMKKDIDKRIIQRFSLEHPKKETQKQIVTENLYKIFNKLIGKYQIRRND
ncbi:MAG TPA: polysaccharide deacetylase family protein [Flavobacterium sp.]|nr:polysaccharide deacetylase family protein [Flavobacterium sp.]